MPHSASRKIPERTLQKTSGVSRLLQILFLQRQDKGKRSLSKEGNEDPSTVSQIQVMLDKQCRNLGGIQSKQIPNREVYWNKWTPTGCLKGCVIAFHKLSREAVTITVLVIDISVLILLGKIRQRRASSLPLPGAQLLTPNEPKRRSAHPADC